MHSGTFGSRSPLTKNPRHWIHTWQALAMRSSCFQLHSGNWLELRLMRLDSPPRVQCQMIIWWRSILAAMRQAPVAASSYPHTSTCMVFSLRVVRGFSVFAFVYIYVLVTYSEGPRDKNSENVNLDNFVASSVPRLWLCTCNFPHCDRSCVVWSLVFFISELKGQQTKPRKTWIGQFGDIARAISVHFLLISTDHWKHFSTNQEKMCRKLRKQQKRESEDKIKSLAVFYLVSKISNAKQLTADTPF